MAAEWKGTLELKAWVVNCMRRVMLWRVVRWKVRELRFVLVVVEDEGVMVKRGDMCRR